MKDCLTNKIYKAGAYLRLSIDDGNKDIESVSIRNQRCFIKEFAMNNNIEVYDYYVDDGYSGGNFDRPAFNRLIMDIEHGIIDCVITKDMSRLGREFIETSNYIFKYFPEHNIRYISILENYDTLNPNGIEDIIPFKAVINDMYLKDISKKITSVRHELMNRGEFVSGTVPYGYKRSVENNKILVVDDYAASIVKKIFEMKSNGMTNCLIARTLTREGVLPPNVYSGRKLNRLTITTNLWKASSVKHILENEAYIGTLIQGKYKRLSLKSKKKELLPKSKWVIKENTLPQIVSKEIFYKVNGLKEKNDIRFRQYDYLLKGLIVCADCGATMTVRRVRSKNSDITPIYLCRMYARYRNNICSMHYYRESDLNELVLEKLRDILFKNAELDKLEEIYDKLLCNLNVLKKYELSLKKYKSKIMIIDKAISNLYLDKASNILSAGEFFSIKRRLEEDKTDYESKICDLEIILSKIKKFFNKKKKRRKYINNFLNGKDFDRQIIKILVNKIEIYENKTIKIHFKFNINGVCNEKL